MVTLDQRQMSSYNNSEPMALMPTHTHSLTCTYIAYLTCTTPGLLTTESYVAVVLSMTEECYEFNDKLSVELRQCKPELDTASEQGSKGGRNRLLQGSRNEIVEQLLYCAYASWNSKSEIIS